MFRFGLSNFQTMLKKPIILLALVSFQGIAYAQQTYQLDIKKSKILWKSPKTVSKHNGYLLFNSGNLHLSATGQPIGGTFNLNMNSISATDQSPAANQKVDLELKTPFFFNATKYPTGTMKVKSVTPVNQPNHYKIMGDLTLKGITNPIEFIAVIKKSGIVITATAELTIDRIKWNIKHQPKSINLYSFVKDKIIADEIPLSLNLIFNK